MQKLKVKRTKRKTITETEIVEYQFFSERTHAVEAIQTPDNNKKKRDRDCRHHLASPQGLTSPKPFRRAFIIADFIAECKQNPTDFPAFPRCFLFQTA